MSEIIINMSGLGQFNLSLDLVDPSNPDDLDEVEVWRAEFSDYANGDCDVIYFEMGTDYEAWDLVDEAIQVFRKEVASE